MKDDIKEILEDLEDCKITKHLNYYLDNKDARSILDYITNLQTIEQQYSAILSENAELENKITNLQEENEKLKRLAKKEGCKN